MTAKNRKPDRTLQAALDEARKRREEEQATFDRAVKRAHEGGATMAEIVAGLGKSDTAVSDSLKRQGITPNAPVTLTPKQSLTQKAAYRRKHG
jgi:hypothetical protein